jgi:hypothetical protein
MNAFLWVGIACTALLVLAVAFDGFDDAFDALDLGPGWLELPVLAAFLAAFGFGTGAFYDAIGAPAMVVGVAAGIAFGWLALRLTAAAVHMSTGITDTEVAMLGSLGRVVTSPTAARYGEVLLDRPTGPVKVGCTADDPLPVGTPIVVVDVRSSTLVHVQLFDPEGSHLPPAPR